MPEAIQITKKEMINFYRNILEPLGMVVSLKPSKPIAPWKPKDADTFEMQSVEALNKSIANLTVQKETLTKNVREVKEKAATYMQSKLPNELTTHIYTGQNQVNKNMIIVQCETLDEVSRRIQWLEQLRHKKYKEELQSGFEELQSGIIDMDMVKENMGSPILKISLQ